MVRFKTVSTLYFIMAVPHTGTAQTSKKMEINQEAPVKQSKQLFIQASPEKVWSVLTDINNWVRWNEKITRAHIEGKPVTGTSFRWTVNGAKIKSVLHTVEPCRAFGWSGVTFGGSAIHNWYLEKREGGAIVKVEESMQGWLVGLFRKKMNKDLEKDMQFWLEQLKRESEK